MRCPDLRLIAEEPAREPRNPDRDRRDPAVEFEDGPTRHWYSPVYAKAHQKGGHFVPWENPEAFVEDVRETFRKLR
jgi:hypothetical protein